LPKKLKLICANPEQNQSGFLAANLAQLPQLGDFFGHGKLVAVALTPPNNRMDFR
jgi:hypothetical protein